MAYLAGRYWIPLDDGTLAQSAERALSGELPQLDFGDPYSGLNAFVGALAFRLFGVRLLSLRIPLVVGFALWLPAVWLLCRRFAPPLSALGGTALAAVLSVPAYPAAMPTWFALFLVTWGTVAVVRFVSDGDEDGPGPRRRLLVMAGVAGGVSVLFKVVGLYFVAAVLLAVARRRSRGMPGAVLAIVGVGTFLILVGRLLLPGGGIVAAVHFFLPVALLGVVVLAAAWRHRHSPSTGSVRALLLDVVAVAAGGLLPVALWVIPYALREGVTEWLVGVFVLPARRLASAASAPPPLWTVLCGLVAITTVYAAGRLSTRAERRLALVLLVLLAAALLADDATGGVVFELLWYSARTWIPALTLMGGWVLARSDGHDDVFVVIAATVMWSLVQFPYTAPAYFFYVAPLAVPATLGLMRAYGRRPTGVLGVSGALYLCLGVGYAAGVARSGTTPLQGERGGIRVSEADARLYDALARVVRVHVGDGALWATPDAPEVYFLTGQPNPTRTIYEFLDSSPTRPDDVAALLDSHDVHVVVLNRRPLFSEPTPLPVLSLLADRFPAADTLGPFVVRWRQAP